MTASGRAARRLDNSLVPHVHAIAITPADLDAWISMALSPNDTASHAGQLSSSRALNIGWGAGFMGFAS